MKARGTRFSSPKTEQQSGQDALQRQESRWPWVVVAVLFVVNLLWTGGLALSHDKALNDRLNYHLTARTLALGDGLAVPAKSDFRVPDSTPPYAVGERPLFPFLASLAIRLAGPSVQTTNFVSALMRTLALLPIFALAFRLFGRWAAVVTGVLYTLSPPWTGVGAVTMTDTTFAFFYYLTLWLAVVYWQRPKRFMALLIGAAFTLTVMSREEGLILGLGLIAILIWRANREPAAAEPQHDGRPNARGGLARWLSMLRPHSFFDLALFLIVPFLGYVGQKVYLWRNFGSFSSAAHPLFFNSEYEFLYALRLQTPQEYLASIGGVGGAIAVRIFNHLSQLRALFADGLLLDSGQAGLFPLTFLLPLGISVWGQARSAWKGSSQARLVCLLGLVIALQGLAFPSFLGRWRLSEIRHVQVITPFLMMLAADGLVRLWNGSFASAQDRSFGPARSALFLRRGLVVLLAIQYSVFVLSYQTLLVDVLAVAPPYDTAEIQVLRQVAPDLESDAILMSRKPNRAAHYTSQPAVMMPLAGFKDLMTYARGHGVTHLVVTRRELQTRPGLEAGLAAMEESIRLLAQVGRVQIYGVQDYDFLPAIAEGGPLDQEIDMAAPAPPPDWKALIARESPSTLSQVWHTWQIWLGRIP